MSQGCGISSVIISATLLLYFQLIGIVGTISCSRRTLVMLPVTQTF